jgi:hypothetical protein
MTKLFLLIDLNGDTYIVKGHAGENQSETLTIITHAINKGLGMELKKNEISILYPEKDTVIGIPIEFAPEFKKTMVLKKAISDGAVYNIKTKDLKSWIMISGETGYVVLTNTDENPKQNEANFIEEVIGFKPDINPDKIKIINPNLNKKLLVIPFTFSGNFIKT